MSYNRHGDRRGMQNVRKRSRDINGGRVELQILDRPPIPGKWLYTKCVICSGLLQYWSLTGEPKPEYENAVCHNH